MSVNVFNFGPKNPLFSFGSHHSKSVFHFVTGPQIQTWNSKVKKLDDFGAKSAIFEELVNSLLKDDREDQAKYFIDAFYYLPPDELNCAYNNAMVALESLEECVPKVAYSVISQKLVTQLSDVVLASSISKTSDHIASELWDALGTLIAQFGPSAKDAKSKRPKVVKKQPVVVEPAVTEPVGVVLVVDAGVPTPEPTGGNQTPPVVKTDDVTDVVAKPAHKVAFVINADLFPTKQGSTEYKKRLHEARNYFAQSDNHGSLIDFVSDEIQFSKKFMVRNLSVDRIIEVYAGAPETVTFEEIKFGVLHKLSVLFLNTEAGNDDTVNDKAVHFALMKEWDSLKNEKKLGKGEQEVLERMNLTQAGQLAAKK